MSMNWGAAADEQRGHRRCGRWKGAEIAVMVLGFIVYWPVGVAMLAFKIWQQRTGYPGDLASFCREGWSAAKTGDWRASPFARSGRPFRGWGGGRGGRGGPWRARPTGNSAFDDWRDGELARLEEERRKLEAAEREFADYINNLRRAKDREEFDRFMRERHGPSGGGDQPGPTG